MPARFRSILVLALLLSTGLTAPSMSADAFLVKPYLQLGDAPAPNGGDLALLWHSADADAGWSVDYQTAGDPAWRKAEAPAPRRVAVPGSAAYRVYRAMLKGLTAGRAFTYRVRKGDEVVFSAEGKARKMANQPYRFVAVGDLAQGTDEQNAVAFRMFQEKPDFVMITGDIVYPRGRASEYHEKYWPVYNAEVPSPRYGAPLLRATPTVAAPGNHDTASRDLGRYPDLLAYFYYWDQPRNGPEKGPFSPPLVGPEANLAAFRQAAGPAFPRMANFSFDYGNAHWTVLDANPYVDWADPALREWVALDLAAARGATWRFVAYHQPGFNSAKRHFGEQQMRLMADVLDAGRVDVVFNGHVHNYQRSFPLRFLASRGPGGKMVRDGDLVPGTWTLDRGFDGQARTRPDGVIYLVTGAGGASLYNPEQQERPATWQTFTSKFISQVHSITVADVDGSTLTVRQVSVDGREVDRFVVTK